MAKIHRIKAKDPSEPKNAKVNSAEVEVEVAEATKKPAEAPAADKKADEKRAKDSKKAEKKAKKALKKANKKPMPKALRIITWPFRMLAKPFIALGRYIKASWNELRQVRWPSRGATWKMVFAILIYAAFFITLIMLLDALFTFIFNNILGS